MGNECGDNIETKKRGRPIDREVNTPLYLLRAVQCGISIRDLDLLSFGTVNDMFIEAGNDNCEYDQLATQDDIKRL